MEWRRRFLLEPDNPFTMETPYGDLRVTLKDDVVHYRRIPGDECPSEEPVELTYVIESVEGSTTLDFLPVYPDRPMVFKPPPDTLAVPPGENGFFCLTLPVGIGVTLRKTDTLLEHLLPAPRKNTYWGAPDNGVLGYQHRSDVDVDPADTMARTDRTIAVVPVYYKNRREDGDFVNRCLVPLRELDLYRNEAGDLVFEVVSLEHLEEFFQKPEPVKRAPREVQNDVTRFLTGPDKARSLLSRVESLPQLDSLTSLFMNR